ncbi:MAG TPA: metal ABC transporter permease, partial [Tepidisphaeraceae bacterium]|nr:metal ABC transporter permease [Tepidisphaeraceae bacterium]
QHYNRQPAWFGTFLFGYSTDLSGPAATAATLLSFAIILTVALLNKEILAYCFDPTTAYTSGVRTGFIHYLLMVLIALVIVIGMRVVGPVLMTALLVLPGATAMLLSRHLSTAIFISIATAIISAIAGLILNSQWRFLPLGPSIVLVLVAEFILAYLASWSRAH